MLSMYVENQKDWDRWLPQLLLTYRSSVHESMGATPLLTCWSFLPLSCRIISSFSELSRVHSIFNLNCTHFCKHGWSINCHRGDKLASITVKPGENHWMLATRFGYLILEHPGASHPSWPNTGQGLLSSEDKLLRESEEKFYSTS